MNGFTKGMHWLWFYYKNTLGMILFEKEINVEYFYNKNVLRMALR